MQYVLLSLLILKKKKKEAGDHKEHVQWMLQKEGQPEMWTDIVMSRMI